MRFLDTTTCQFVEADPRNEHYAILSHTWDRGGEQTYQGLKRVQERYTTKESMVDSECDASVQLDDIAHSQDIWDDPDLSPKIFHACAVARRNGFRLIWVDSCCIDKTSSSELSEAINSMYSWYATAQVCFAYLVDVDPGDNHSEKNSQLRGSIWFKRGWTLQELIAPYEVIILSKDWQAIGSKRDLVDIIEDTTSINEDALLHKTPLGQFSVAQRLSWASHRRTTRVEDRAYSLLGIFSIHIPTLYGEGELAFRRLQEAIMERIPDQSVFSSGSICENHDIEALLDPKQPDLSSSFEPIEIFPVTSILPLSPLDFATAGSITPVPHDEVYDRLKISNLSPPEYTSTPHGIRTQLPVIPLDLFLPPSTAIACRSKYSSLDRQWYLVVLACQSYCYPGCLIGSVCYIPSSKSGLNVLYRGMMRMNCGADLEPRRSSSANLFPLSYETIERCRAGIELKGVYIAHPNPTAPELTSLGTATVTRSPSLSRPPRKTIYLSLTRKAHDVLRTSGYAVDIYTLDGDDADTTRRIVTLSREDHTITVEYRYTQNQEGYSIDRTLPTVTRAGGYQPQNNEQAEERRPGGDAPPSDYYDAESKRHPEFLAYSSLPTKGILPQKVVISASDASRTMELKLNFERWSSFTLEIDISASRKARISQRQRSPQIPYSKHRLSLTPMLCSRTFNTNVAASERLLGPIKRVTVAHVHPLINAATPTFHWQSTVELEVEGKKACNRTAQIGAEMRNNTIIAPLWAEMRSNTMSALVQLKDINNKRAGKHSPTVSECMQHFVDITVEDFGKFTDLGNAYTKKSLLERVLHTSSWSDEFKGCFQRFTDRGREFEPPLHVYIGPTVASGTNIIGTIPTGTKIDPLLQHLEASMSLEEHQFAKFLDYREFSDVVMGDNILLRQLLKSHATTACYGPNMPAMRWGQSRVGRNAVDTPLSGFQKDAQMSVYWNMEQFNPNMVIRQCGFGERFSTALHWNRETPRKGNRVMDSDADISPLYDNILDPDIYHLWKDKKGNSWESGQAKDRDFVLALSDYFIKKLKQIKLVKNVSTSTVPTQKPSGGNVDEWTLEHIDVTRVPLIIEAFDGETPGFITVTEVNTFTAARPENWSLLHWLAYWAVGHQISMSNYAAKIDLLLDNMSLLKSYVLSANRNAVEEYLYNVWNVITLLTSAFRRVEVNEQLLHRFNDYTEMEEKHLSENLRTAKYNITARDTLDRIHGPGPIEKHVFPLLYLLLEHHLGIMHLARTQCLRAGELRDSMHTVLWVFSAVHDRHMYLADRFTKQALDLSEQFKVFAFEIFKEWHDKSDILLRKTNEMEMLEPPNPDNIEAQDIDSAQESFHQHHFTEAELGQNADPAVRKILGHWSGFCARKNLYPSQTMLCLNLHASSTNPKEFYCKGITPNGTEWNLTGQYTVSDDGRVHYAFNIVYISQFSTQFFSAELYEDGKTLSGSWGSYDKKPFTFIFKRLSSEAIRFYPTPIELSKNKPRALWHFAISAAMAQVCRKMYPWTWLRKRWQTGLRYVDLLVRRTISPLTAEEVFDLAECQRTITPQEACLYQIFRDVRQRDVSCGACRARIISSNRIICLLCGMKATVDLCSKEECFTSEMSLNVRGELISPHLPSHDILKLRTAIHPYHEYCLVYRTAPAALKRVRQRFAHLDSSDVQKEGGDEGSARNQIPECIICRERASLPCWHCIECEEDVFVCISCDDRYGGVTRRNSKHKSVHTLVCCRSPHNGTYQYIE